MAKIKKIFLFYKSAYIGIDIGTSFTLICDKENNLLLNEPSIVSYLQENNIKSNYLYGYRAKELIGKVPFRIEVVSPIKDSIVSNYDIADNMLRFFVNKAIYQNSKFNFRPNVIANIPFSATDVEKRIVQEILERLNIKSSFLIYNSVVSAIGAGIDLDKPIGSMIIDIGGGTTEISSISLGGIIENKTFKYGGKKIDVSITEFIEKKYSVLIGENVAEDIREQIGCIYLKPDDENKTIVVQGRDLKNDAPCDLTICQEDIVYATAEFTNMLIDNLMKVFKATPPELMKDIISNGIIVCGGLAHMQNIDYVIQKITGVKVVIPKNPELCLIRGLCKIVSDYKNYKSFLFQQIA